MKYFLAIICLGLLLGCTRPPAFQQPVKADTPLSFTMWRSDLGDALTPQEWAWFDLAIQEFKFQIMKAGQVTGSEAIDEAMREKIDGRKLVEVMQQGLGLRVQRIQSDKTELEYAMQINARSRIKPSEARELAEFQKNLEKKLAKMNEEIAGAEAELKELELKAE